MVCVGATGFGMVVYVPQGGHALLSPCLWSPLCGTRYTLAVTHLHSCTHMHARTYIKHSLTHILIQAYTHFLQESAATETPKDTLWPTHRCTTPLQPSGHTLSTLCTPSTLTHTLSLLAHVAAPERAADVPAGRPKCRDGPGAAAQAGQLITPALLPQAPFSGCRMRSVSACPSACARLSAGACDAVCPPAVAGGIHRRAQAHAHDRARLH